jgi:hypothetical protein
MKPLVGFLDHSYMKTNKSTTAPKGPGSLLAAIPHLLGFVPINSLVLVALDLQKNQVVLAMRLDLSDFSDEQIVEQAMMGLGDAQASVQIDSVLSVIYSERDFITFRSMAADLIKAQAEVCDPQDPMWVSNGRYGSILCENDSCCPSEGYELPVDTSLEKLKLISAGKSVLQSRQVIEDYFAPTKENAKLTKALKKLRAAQQRSRKENWNENLYNRALVNLLDDSSDLNELAQSEIILITEIIDLRDKLISEVLGEIQIAQEPLSLLHLIKTRLLPLIQGAADDQAKGVLAVLAIWMWQLGEAVWAESAINHSLALDPGYRLSLLTMSALKSGLPPWKFADCFGPTG